LRNPLFFVNFPYKPVFFSFERMIHPLGFGKAAQKDRLCFVKSADSLKSLKFSEESTCIF